MANPYRRLWMKPEAIQLQATPSEDGDSVDINAYFAMYGNEFPYLAWNLMLAEGAFADSIDANPDVVFLYNHMWTDVPMARTPHTLTLEDREQGVYGTATVSLKNQQSAALVDAIDRGDVRSTSIGFFVEEYEIKREGELEVITKANLDYGDVSAVTHPANPMTENEISVALMSQPIRPVHRAETVTSTTTFNVPTFTIDRQTKAAIDEVVQAKIEEAEEAIALEEAKEDSLPISPAEVEADLQAMKGA